jgi:hypothetical protein
VSLAENGAGIELAAYEDGVERLAAAVEAAAQGERDWDAQVSAGLRSGLDFLAADPALAHLLLVESLAAGGPIRLEHERSLERLAEALRPPAGRRDSEVASAEMSRLLAGGLVSHLSRRVLGGEAERLAEDHDLLLQYLYSSLYFLK